MSDTKDKQGQDDKKPDHEKSRDAFNTVWDMPDMMFGCCGFEDIERSCREKMREICCPQPGKRNESKARDDSIKQS